MTIIQAAADRIGALRDRSDEIERARRIPADIARDFAAAGIYRMLVPSSVGGGQVEPSAMARTLIALANGDSAAAWCAMTGATTGLCTAYLDSRGLEEIGGDASATYAGVFAPMGRAVRDGDGYRVTGRWSFGSGCESASWRLGGAITDLGDGTKHHRVFFFPADDTTVHDTWDVAGLQGTGSHDMSVDDVFVPAHRSGAIVDARPIATGPLYAFPVFGLLAAGIGAVAVGMAERAANDAATESGAKRKRSAFQQAYAQAQGEAAAARALLLSCLDETFQRVASASAMALADRARVRIAASQAVRASVRAIDALYEACGGGAIYKRSRLQRHFRDIHTITQHVMVASGSLTLAGRALLGSEGSFDQL